MTHEDPDSYDSKQNRAALDADSIEVLRAELTAKYANQGLFTSVYTDEPNETSEAHAHGAATLLTLKGSAKVRLDDGEWQVVIPGDITTIKDQQLHEVIVGEDGWEYLFACSQDEAKRQGLIS